jgi:hypothetical protein
MFEYYYVILSFLHACIKFSVCVSQNPLHVSRLRFLVQLKVCKSVHHCTVQINHQPDATVLQFIILTFIYSSTGFLPAIIRSSVTAVAASGFTFISW